MLQSGSLHQIQQIDLDTEGGKSKRKTENKQGHGGETAEFYIIHSSVLNNKKTTK